MEELVRDFKGVWIPKDIWLDKRLNALDKIILVEIDSLDATEEGCYASNEYLAEFCQCSETKISTAINKLIEFNYLEIIKFDGRKRFIKSRLSKNERQTLKKLKADFKKMKDINLINNINNNNININKKENKEKKKPTLEEIQQYIKEKQMNVDAETFYNYFNESNWIDSKGNKVKNWKQKLITWNSYNKSNKKEIIPSWFGKEIKKDERYEFSDEDKQRFGIT